MTRQHRYDDAFDDNGILKNHRSYRVSLTARDAVMARSGTGSHGPRGAVVGDLCTIDGQSGRLRMVNGSLQCVPVKSSDSKPQFTDGYRPVDPAAGLRPGWRMPAIRDASQQAVADCYDRYNTSLVNAYKLHDGEMQCPECFGSGCNSCSGSGVMPDASAGGSRFGSRNEGGDDDPDPASDSITLDQHRRKMDRLYRERDAELSNAWRKG